MIVHSDIFEIGNNVKLAPLPPGTMFYQKIPHAVDDIVAEPQHCVRGKGRKMRTKEMGSLKKRQFADLS